MPLYPAPGVAGPPGPAAPGGLTVLPPTPQTGRYYPFPAYVTGATGQAMVVNELRAVPFAIAQRPTVPLTTLSAESTATGTGTVRVGIYSADAGSWEPGPLLVELGTASLAAAGRKSFTLTAPYNQLDPGLYYAALVCQTAAVAFRGYALALPMLAYLAAPAGSAFASYTMTGVTGALPARYTPTGGAATAPRFDFAA